MATAWQSLEEAALTLGISSRTLHRRLGRGELDTRLENGRREVLVAVGESDISVASVVSESSEPPAESFDEQSEPAEAEQLDEQDIGGTMLALHEDRIRRTDLAIMAYQQSVNVTAADARRTHRNLRVAWSMAGGLTVIAFLAVTWATHSITKAHGEVTSLSATVRQLSDTADRKSRDAETFRKEAESARLAAAWIEGQLESARARVDELSDEKAHIESKLSAAAVTSATTQPLATTQPVH